MRFKLNRKAQVGHGLQTLVFTLMVVGIVLGVGFLVLREFTESMEDNHIATILNETVLPTDSGRYVKLNSTTDGICEYNTFKVILVVNETSNGTIISSGNYTYNSSTGKITNLTDIYPKFNVTYSYQHGGDACLGVEDTITAVQEIPSWLVIIAIIAIVGILLALVFQVFPKGGGESRGWSFGRGSSSGVTAEI